MGILDSPPQIFIFDWLSPPQIRHLWALDLDSYHHGLNIHKHFSFHHHGSNIHGHFSYLTTMDQTSMGTLVISLLWIRHPQALQLFHYHRFSSMGVLDSPPQIIYLWAFQIHHHRFSSMGLDQFSPPQIKHLQAFQIHHHRFSSMGLDQFSPPQTFIYGHFTFTTTDYTSMGILVFTTINQTSMGI